MCPICNGTVIDLGRLGGRHVFRCQDCGVEFTEDDAVGFLGYNEPAAWDDEGFYDVLPRGV